MRHLQQGNNWQPDHTALMSLCGKEGRKEGGGRRRGRSRREEEEKGGGKEREKGLEDGIKVNKKTRIIKGDND